MKMLTCTMLSGELSNSATFFSTFANVSTNDCRDLRGTFGSSPLCKWKPWPYANRLKVFEAVDSFKASLEGKPLSVKLKRSKVTEFIARQKSRQESLPLVGKLIDNRHHQSIWNGRYSS